MLKIALIQQICNADRKANLAASTAGVRTAAAQGARLIVLPELHTSPYFCQMEDPAQFDHAETIPGPTTHELGQLAAELNVVIVASIFERRSPGLYHNTAVALDIDGRIAGKYRKMHIPDDPGYHEKFYFTPGDLGFTPIITSLGKLGIMVCWDQWYPEAARLMALGGADILIYPTAIGWEPRDDGAEKTRQRDAWTTVQRAHAIANGLPLIACNRTGFEAHPANTGVGIDFWGSSFIAGPQGEILASAPSSEATVLLAELDLARSEQVRRLWPYLRDRRIDAYQGLDQRYLA
jgi:N-carbamoylputrescine amidase